MSCICTEQPPPEPAPDLEVWASRPDRPGIVPTVICEIGTGLFDAQVKVRATSGHIKGRAWWTPLLEVDPDLATLYARLRCVRSNRHALTVRN